jgi:zinc protease
MIQIFNEAQAQFLGTEVHTLDNGMRLVLKEDHTVPVVSLQAWARCGAIDESPDIYGISHGLEHMVFKGTPTRSAGQITRAIESKGGSMNAATQLETTHYYIEIPSYGTTTALNVLSDTILNPTFPQDELERERLVILEEIHRRDDNPEATLWDEFISHVFKGTPYEIKVIGNVQTVSAMSRRDLMSYYRKHYVPANTSLVIVGDFQKNRLVAQLEKLFSKQKKQARPATPRVTLEHREPTSMTVEKPVQLAYVAMGIPTVGFGHPDMVALDVLADVIGGGTSARFYQKLREDEQAVLSVSCDYIAFQQKGLFGFFFETLPQKAGMAVTRLTEELERIARAPFLPAELSRAKARIKSEWLHGSETYRGQASTLGSLVVLDQMQLINTYLKQIDALTVDHLMEAYRTYVAGRKFFTTRIEPQKI